MAVVTRKSSPEKLRQAKAYAARPEVKERRKRLDAGRREEIRAVGRAWAATPEAKRKRKAYDQANLEKVKAAKAKWRESHPHPIRPRTPELRSYQAKWKREWRTNNLEVAREYDRKFYKENIQTPRFKLTKRLRNRLGSAIKNRSKRGSAVALLGCTVEHLIAHLESQFQPGMTWENWSLRGWHIDHKKALTGFDLEDPKQLTEACHYTNLQPLWAVENIRKGNKL